MVSRNTLRVIVRAEDLVEELSLGAAQRLRCTSDDIEHVMRAAVAYLIDEYPAQDFYIPASFGPVAYPVDDMRRAVAAGESVRSICRRFHVDRRTLYRLLDSAPPAA